MNPVQLDQNKHDVDLFSFPSKSEVIGGEASYLGKLTSCQSGLTPLNSSFKISII
jgi:hypothetical protein